MWWAFSAHHIKGQRPFGIPLKQAALEPQQGDFKMFYGPRSPSGDRVLTLPH